MEALYHLVPGPIWAAAQQVGRYAPESLDTEGFVHCSFAGQVERTANALYKSVPDLVVVQLDPAKVGAEIRVEDSYGGGESFPHVYGPVPSDAAVAVHPVSHDPDGTVRIRFG
ncbi:MAG: DUF952 domain-containing protein [Jatrophihabitans sp.]